MRPELELLAGLLIRQCTRNTTATILIFFKFMNVNSQVKCIKIIRFQILKKREYLLCFLSFFPMTVKLIHLSL